MIDGNFLEGDVGDIIMLTFSRSWWQSHYTESLYVIVWMRRIGHQNLKQVINILHMSPRLIVTNVDFN